MKERVEYFDLLRVLACFLVVLTHSVMPSVDGSDGLYVFGLSFVSSPSSELFLAISGALLLPTKVSMSDFYKRRFTKLIPPLIFWSIVGGFVEVMLDRFSVEQYINSVLMIPFKPITGVYWFMYVMIGLYLVAPVISEWLKKSTKKQLHFVLAIWGITLLWPYFKILLDPSYQEIGSHYDTLNYFGGFLGYWILGYYLRRFPIKIGWNICFILPIIALVINTLVIIYYKFTPIDKSEYFLTNLQIGSAAMVMLIFTAVQTISIQPPNTQLFRWGGQFPSLLNTPLEFT